MSNIVGEGFPEEIVKQIKLLHQTIISIRDQYWSALKLLKNKRQFW